MNKPAVLPLSVIVIARNAARTLARALASVHGWVDEIILVDSGSTDTTLTIARQYGCRITFRRFDGFGPQKNHALRLARNPWVLVLDADEEVSGALADELQQGFRTWRHHYQGFTVPRNQFFLGRPLRYGGQYRQPVLRIFNRQHGGITPWLVNEEVIVGGKLLPLQSPLLHYNSATVGECLDQLNTRITYSAQERIRVRKKVSLPGQVVCFLAIFFRLFVLQRGYKDGLNGLIWALLSALEPILEHQKYRELVADSNAPRQYTFTLSKPLPRRIWNRRYRN
ncbi:glycosyltransferase family 2 protein [Nibrella viscosa]|uniref:Glycosyltransferase family 2 protein n=1 Tax=Nibrella viscosa TaxID=1084524 RepID=A0ABP8K114_9BACT